MSELIVMRHGEASWDAPSDPERELTPRGELCARNAGIYLDSIHWQPDLLLSSPFIRARQTLAAVQQSFTAVDMHIEPVLTPGHAVEQVCDFLNGLTQQRVLIVSHQPLVGRLLGWLVHSDTRHHSTIDTATMTLLSADGFMAGGADIVWQKTAAQVSELI